MSRHDLSRSKLGGSSHLGVTRLGDANHDDPMGSFGNLMDVMLVFACGLLLALIANWNVDIDGDSAESGIKEVEGNLEEVQAGIDEADGSYTEMGTVYRDEETGQLYIVER